MELQVGNKVEVVDSSYSYYIGDEGIKDACCLQSRGEFEVIQVGCKMPMWYRVFGKKADPCYDDTPDNDTLIKELATGKIVSIQERFLRKVEPVKPAFKVGDRVRCIKEFDWRTEAVGKIGTVIEVKDNYYSVQFDENINGHSGFGERVKGIKGCCWCFDPEYLEIAPINQAPENKTETMLSITFTFKGSQTICRIEENGRKFKGSAKCNPGDEWNEQIGKDLSMARAEIKRANHDIRKATGHK